MNSTSGLCQSCTLTGCSTCKTADYCQTCLNGYSLNALTGNCILCNITGCSKCLTTNVCADSCPNGTSPLKSAGNSNNVVCIPCKIDNCLQCQTANNCFKCADGMLPDAKGKNCFICNITDCAACSSNNLC